MSPGPNQLISSLEARGVKIWAENGQVCLHSPKGAILPEEMAKLRALKAEIIERVEEQQSIASIPLLRRSAAAPVPLTATQRMPWHYPHEEGLSHATIAFAFRIFGPLNVPLLSAALDTLRRRHEALRTRIATVDGTMAQYIEPFKERRLTVVEASGADGARRYIQEFVDHQLDYSVDTPFEARIIRLADDHHLLVASADHVICDGISSEIVKRDIWSLYDGELDRYTASQPKLSLQFADYAVWLKRLYPYWRKKYGVYWTERLAKAPPVRWPSDVGQVAQRSIRFALLRASIDDRLMTDLMRFAQKSRTLPALVMLSVFVATVSRWSNQRDLTVAFVDSGRFRHELFQMVGCLVSHLHLRIKLAQQHTFADLLELVKQEFNVSSAHRDFDWVPSLIPEFKADLYFNWFSPADAGNNESFTASGGMSIEMLTVSPQIALPTTDAEMPFKLSLACSPAGSSMTANLLYRADCLEARAVQHMSSNLRLFLEAMIDRPSVRVDSVL